MHPLIEFWWEKFPDVAIRKADENELIARFLTGSDSTAEVEEHRMLWEDDYE
jgi:hypothetical protein